MSDSKISDLTAYTSPITTDVVPIVDVTTSTTKKITWSNIRATLKTYFDTLYGAVTSVAVSGGTTGIGVSGSPITTSGTITLTVPAATSVASTVVARDTNQNTFSNDFIVKSTSTATAGGTTTLTVASTPVQIFTGTLAQTIVLPDATTLTNGKRFWINNNSSGVITLQDAGANTIYSAPAGGYSQVNLLSNGSVNGTWDIHPVAPSTVTWGSGTTGLVMNTALTTTPSIGAGASSSTVPSFIPQRGSSTTGLGGDSTNLYLILGGSSKLSVNSSGHMTVEGVTSTGATGTGNLVFSTTPTLTTPKIVTNIADTNGNTLINIGATASAVNYVKFTNAATGTSGPILSSDGETNVDLKIAAKGTGAVHFTTGTYGDLTSDTDGATVTFDMSVSNLHTVTLGGNRTLAVSNVKAGQVFTIVLVQDGTGSRTVTWFSTIKWAAGTTPTLTTTINKADIFTFVATDSTHFYGTIAGQNF